MPVHSFTITVVRFLPYALERFRPASLRTRAIEGDNIEVGGWVVWSVDQLVSWSLGQLVSGLVSWSVGQLVSGLVGWWVGGWSMGRRADLSFAAFDSATAPPTHRPTDPPTHQPTNPPTHRPTNPPTHQPTNPPTH